MFVKQRRTACERLTGDCVRDVTDGIEDFVSRTEIARLADDEAAHRVKNVVHGAQGLLHTEARNRLELIQCAARVTQASP